MFLYERRNQLIKGEITAFLSLIFILIVAFISALMESASIQVTKNNRRAEADGAIHSVFAEYQKVLLEEYDIFGLEGTYETGNFSEDLIMRRLDYYGGGDMEQKITKLQLLTDQGGSGFQEQVIRYMHNKIGLDALDVFQDKLPSWQGQLEDGEKFVETDNAISQDLETEMGNAEGELAGEGNPLGHVDALKKSTLLQIIVPEPEKISNRRIVLGEQPSKRQLLKGRGTLPRWEGLDGVQSKLFLNEYMLDHFSTATDDREERALSYEVEYVLEGKESDQENLEAVIKKLMLMGIGANYAYLQLDKEKQMEAGALALTLSSLIALPVLTEAVKQAILAGWAFGESIMDLRSLLDNKKVPLIKNRDSWQLQLDNLLKLGTSEDQQEGKDNSEGQTYKEYLRMLLFLDNQEQGKMRSLDLIEGNLKKTFGLTFFRVDHCISKIELTNTSNIRNGITYQFSNYYGYQ